MSPTMPPAGTRSDRSSTATTPPYRTVRRSTSRTVGASGAGAVRTVVISGAATGATASVPVAAGLGAGRGGDAAGATRAKRSARSWPPAARPSGLRMSVTMTRTPLMITNASPLRSIHSSMRKNTMPPAAMIPAWTPPKTEVTPARYAVERRVRPSERGEALPGDDALAVGEEAAGDAGDERRDREAEDLDEDDVDADARRPSARWPARRASPTRASSSAARATPKATTTQTIRHMKPKDRRGKSLPMPTPRSSRRLGFPDRGCRRSRRTRCCGTRSPRCRTPARSVTTPEGQAPQPQGREPDDDADDRRGQRGEERRERERHAPVDRAGSSA